MHMSRQNSMLYIPFWLYSNCTKPYILCGYGVFTFHSGYILICTYKRRVNRCWWLYIPFWLYSNIICFLILSLILSLYIPFWLYSNWNETYFKLNYTKLYIPFWLYSNQFDTGSHSIRQSTLHSILVIF